MMLSMIRFGVLKQDVSGLKKMSRDQSMIEDCADLRELAREVSELAKKKGTQHQLLASEIAAGAGDAIRKAYCQLDRLKTVLELAPDRKD